MSLKSEMEELYRKECEMAKGTTQVNQFGTYFTWNDKKNHYEGIAENGKQWVMGLQSRTVPMYWVCCKNMTGLFKKKLCNVNNMFLLSDHGDVKKCRSCKQDILVNIALDPKTPQYQLLQRIMRGE